ncbi:MAG: DUF1127 domain-containing protein [Alphaproteobacteria bacterium]|nr:DUF1127 domain-containing protein [Alphaproteobacteria bacterium]
MTRSSASQLQARIGFSPRRSGLLATVVERLAEWQERARSRVLLGRMDDRMLRDMGISRSDVDVEVAKPFWRP